MHERAFVVRQHAIPQPATFRLKARPSAAPDAFFPRRSGADPLPLKFRGWMTKPCWAAMAALCCFVSPVWASADDQARIEEPRKTSRQRRRADAAQEPSVVYAPAARHGRDRRSARPVRRARRPAGDGGAGNGARLQSRPRSRRGPDERRFLHGELPAGIHLGRPSHRRPPGDVGDPPHRGARHALRPSLSRRARQAGAAVAGQRRGRRSAGMRWPLDEINVSSGFGLRSDPLSRPTPSPPSQSPCQPEAGTGRRRAGGPVRPGRPSSGARC